VWRLLRRVERSRGVGLKWRVSRSEMGGGRWKSNWM
jgi:hypothetical protein